MPWTIVHPLAVLPLRRLTPRPLDFAALVVGSMTPDAGYFINRFDLSTFAHTLPGSFIACVPTGVIMLCAMYLFCRPVCYALPAPHREALLSICQDFPVGLRRWLSILLSLLLGAWTHNFWDAFTHEHGWFVDRIAWLRQPVMQLPPITMQVYLALQEGGTLIGFALVVLVYCLWLRRQPKTHSANSESDTWRYLFWFAIVAVSLAIAIPAANQYATSVSRRGFLFGRSVLFCVATYAPMVGVPLVLVGSSVIYARRTRVEKSFPFRNSK